VRVLDIINRIKEWVSGQDRRRLIENAAIVVIIGVIIIIAGSTIFSRKNNEIPIREQKRTVLVEDAAGQGTFAADSLEQKLKSVLAQIQGVGKVDVMITYEDRGEEIPAYDTRKSESSTQEEDSEGGSRIIAQQDCDSTLAYEDGPGGGKKPVILKEKNPEVRGVLVVAEGAGVAAVRQQIISAVTVVLDVPLHKVEVAQRKK